MNRISTFLLAAACLASAPFAQQPAQPQGETGVLRARHILVPWKGAASAGPEVTRTEAEAEAHARKLHTQLEGGADFAKLATEHSSCPSKAMGGYLGHFRRGRMVPEFEKACAGADADTLVEPIKSQFGWHVIYNMKALDWPETVDASHILISHKDAQSLGPSMKRTKDEAKKLADELYAQLQEKPGSFEELARKHSDDKTSGARGGALGVAPPDRYVPVFADHLVATEAGDIASPVETPFGYHIIQRKKVQPPLGAKHILIPFQGATRAPADAKSKDDARKLAEELLTKLCAETPADFGKLANEHSSCPSKARGGDLGTFRSGEMVPAFEKAVAAAEVGAVVGPVESPFGFHVIQRTK